MKPKTSATSATRKPSKRDHEFIARAERAFKTVAKQIRAEAKRDGTKPLVWKN